MIAFGGQPLRVERDLPAKQQDDHRDRADRAPVAAGEFSGAITERVGTGGDRLVFEVAPQIVREFADRRVSLGRILLERLGENGLEVAAHAAPQPVGRRASL